MSDLTHTHYIVRLLANGYLVRSTFAITPDEAASKYLNKRYEPGDMSWKADFKNYVRDFGAEIIKVRLEEVV